MERAVVGVVVATPRAVVILDEAVPLTVSTPVEVRVPDEEMLVPTEVAQTEPPTAKTTPTIRAIINE
jgi:hypothetical protein